MIGKVLIADGVSTNRIVFKVKLAAAGYHTLLAGDGAACLRLARSDQPDLILLDLVLSDEPGVEVVRRLKADALTRRIPVIMLASAPDAADRMAALSAGAEDFLARPVDDQTLLARLRGILRARNLTGGLAAQDSGLDLFGLAEPPAEFEMPGQVALILDRADDALHLRRALSAIGPDRIEILGPQAVHGKPEGVAAPDVYLIDADFGAPGGGLRLMSELLSRSHSRHAAFCIYNRQSPHLVPATAFDLGANDLVEAGVSNTELALRLHALVGRKREADRMRASVQDGLRLAVIDSLTGLHNRRYGIAQLNAIASRAQAEGSEFAVMVVDLDRFKSVNDGWGHGAGDAVLVEVASRLAGNLRASDLLARIGGEEFLIALPGTSLEEAETVAERLCRMIEAAPVLLADGTRIKVTISIGLTISSAAGDPAAPGFVSDLIDQADRALMKSKTAGRNQVTIIRNAA
jgi:two-component system, cell cycle response regulator